MSTDVVLAGSPKPAGVNVTPTPEETTVEEGLLLPLTPTRAAARSKEGTCQQPEGACTSRQLLIDLTPPQPHPPSPHPTYR
jgi:hypothetical protein